MSYDITQWLILIGLMCGFGVAMLIIWLFVISIRQFCRTLELSHYDRPLHSYSLRRLASERNPLTIQPFRSPHEDED
jgi:hypothetical protein